MSEQSLIAAIKGTRAQEAQVLLSLTRQYIYNFEKEFARCREIIKRKKKGAGGYLKNVRKTTRANKQTKNSPSAGGN